MRKGPIRALRPVVALPVFLVAKCIQCVAAGVVYGSIPVWGVAVLTMLVYGTIAWFAFKRQLVSIWAMTIIMLFEGVGQVSDSLAAFDAAPALHTAALVVAGYVILGGMALFVNRPRRVKRHG